MDFTNILFPASNLFGSGKDRRQSSSMLPTTPRNDTAGGGYYGNTLSGQDAFRDTDRYAMGVVPEPIEGNSMTQFMRSMNNWGGVTGTNQYGTSGGAVGNAMDYYSNILNAKNSGAITQAMQPEISSANNMFEQQRRQVDQYAPSGGGRAASMANMPFQRAGAISQIMAQARPQAAAALGQLGTSQQQTALDLIKAIIGSQISMRGQDVGEHGQSMALAGQLGSGFMGGFSSGFGQGVGGGGSSSSGGI